MHLRKDETDCLSKSVIFAVSDVAFELMEKMYDAFVQGLSHLICGAFDLRKQGHFLLGSKWNDYISDGWWVHWKCFGNLHFGNLCIWILIGREISIEMFTEGISFMISFFARRVFLVGCRANLVWRSWFMDLGAFLCQACTYIHPVKQRRKKCLCTNSDLIWSILLTRLFRWAELIGKLFTWIFGYIE